ncbi:MAG: cyclic nucleotide-binding domain-containing protein [Solirubrobacteraceae bacterium]|jgi:CRP-like cAMP-binding protein
MRTIDELIVESPTFQGLSDEQLKLIAGCAVNEHYEAGELLLREGDPAERFYLIRHGMIVLEMNAPGRGALQIQTLGEGDVLGWSWLFAPHRWAMDGRTVQESSLVAFDGTCLRDKCEEDHELGYELMKRFAANLIDRLQATRLQLIDVYGRDSVTA